MDIVVFDTESDEMLPLGKVLRVPRMEMSATGTRRSDSGAGSIQTLDLKRGKFGTNSSGLSKLGEKTAS